MNEPLSKKILRIIEKTYPNCSDKFLKKNNYFFPLIAIKSNFFKNKIISLPFIDVGGLFGNFTKKDISYLINNLKGRKNDSLEIKINTHQPNFSKNSEILKSVGFKEEKLKHQYLIELENREEMWKKFHKHTRNDIRKAEKSGLKLKKIVSKEELKKFYKLYFREMKRFGTPCHSFKLFKNILKEGGKNNFLGLNCYKDKKVIAGIMALYSKDLIYLWFNVSNPKFRMFRPNDLLYWGLIKESIDKKIKILDIGQINLNSQNKRAKGLSKFKQKWLGISYQKYCFHYNFKGQFEQKEISKKKEKLKEFRKVWSKLPNFFIKIIGPKLTSNLGI